MKERNSVRLTNFFVEACLKIWDSLCWGNGKVDSVAHGGYSKGESGTLRLIRTVCKAIQERGSEKSGRTVQFSTFMKHERGEELIPLSPFLGNRFNILFYNGGAAYFLEDHLKVFFDRVGKENRFLSAVQHDLDLSTFFAGCRALGMIDKLVTALLWHMIENKGHIF